MKIRVPVLVHPRPYWRYVALSVCAVALVVLLLLQVEKPAVLIASFLPYVLLDRWLARPRTGTGVARVDETGITVGGERFPREAMRSAAFVQGPPARPY